MSTRTTARKQRKNHATAPPQAPGQEPLAPAVPTPGTRRSPSPSLLDGRTFAQVANTPPPPPRTPPAPTSTPVRATTPAPPAAQEQAATPQLPCVPDAEVTAGPSMLPAPAPSQEPATTAEEVEVATDDLTLTEPHVESDLATDEDVDRQDREGPSALTIRIPAQARARPPSAGATQASVTESEAMWAVLGTPPPGFSQYGTPDTQAILTPHLPTWSEVGSVGGADRDDAQTPRGATPDGEHTDENHPPALSDRTASKRPWVGSPNVEEQARRTLGQRRPLHRQATILPTSDANPWAGLATPRPRAAEERAGAPFLSSTPRPSAPPTHVFAPATAMPNINLPFDFTHPTPSASQRGERSLNMQTLMSRPPSTIAMDVDEAEGTAGTWAPVAQRNATPGPSTTLRRRHARVEDEVEEMYAGPPPPGLVLPRPQPDDLEPSYAPIPGPYHAPERRAPRTPTSARPAAYARTRLPSPGGSAPPVMHRAPLHHLPWPQHARSPPRPLPRIPEVLSPARERHFVAAALHAPPELLPEAVENEDDGDLLVTPIPDEGYPAIHRDDPEAPFQGQSRGWVRRMWRDPPGTVAFIQIWDYAYGDGIRQNRLIAERLTTAIRTITGEADFYVVPPERDPAAPAGRDMPFLWAIRNLSPPGGQQVVSRLLWSFPEITFFAFARTIEFPSWLFALEGFVHANEATITGTVRAVLERPEHRRMIEEMLGANPAYAGANRHDALRLILASLRVEILTLNNGNIIANVYMNSPTRDVRRWRAWVAHLRSLEYGDYTNATATPRDLRWCRGCRSTAHPTHRCPFPDLPGWNGPRVEDDGPAHLGGDHDGGYPGGRGRGGMRGRRGGARGGRGNLRRGF